MLSNPIPASTLASDSASSNRAATTRIFLLERVTATSGSGESLLPTAAKTLALFAYLCLSGGQEIRKLDLVDLLWGESRQGADMLRQALLDLSRVPAAWCLSRERRTVSLHIGACWVDIFEIPDSPELLLNDLYGISSRFDMWVLRERAKYETHWNTLLHKQIVDLSAANTPPAERILVARKLQNLRPDSSTAICALMNAFNDMGEPAEAIRAFERYRMVIENDDLPVSDKALSLYQAIRRQSAFKSIRRDLVQNTSPTITSSPTAQPAEDALRLNRSYTPSVAVFPLRNLSGDAASGHVVEGITEDLVETLSRVPDLFVIARLSTEALVGRARSSQEIGAALGVRYVLSGSVRIFGNRYRLVVELADTQQGICVWRSRIDETTSHILDVQSGLAHEAVRALVPHVRASELRYAVKKDLDEYTAYDFFLRAQESMHSPSRAVFSNAETLFDSAIGRDPHYAIALAWRAYWHVMRVGQSWSPDPAVDAFNAEGFAERAIEADPTEAMGFAARGHVAAYLHKDFDLALEYLNRALKLNQNCARAWLWSASVHGWTGSGASAVKSIEQAMALSPYDPLGFAFSASASLAHLVNREYDRAAEFAMRAVRENRSYSSAYKLLIPALMLSGRTEDARHAGGQLLRLEPEFTVERFRKRSPGAGGESGQLVAESLARAGIPIS